MGAVHSEVLSLHLDGRPAEEPIVARFLNGFDISWARRRVSHNTHLSCYILRPEKFMQDTFGLETEIALFISDYESMQPRTIQAINHLMLDEPLRGRIDPSIFFVVSADPNIETWIREYTSQSPYPRVPIAFARSELINLGASDAWFVRNLMARQLFTRDLFDNKLPVTSDLYFFGRDAIVQEIIDAIRRSENRGIFGLRKTGKTSVLFKVRRHCVDNGVGKVIYLDCKSPAIRSLDWRGLLQKICDELRALFRTIPEIDGVNAEDKFAKLAEAIPPQARICIIFDEIEYISFLAKLDDHWKRDYLPFWQVLWSVQSTTRKLSYIIAGVNAHLAEVDLVDGVQNPMFGIISPHYLRGLELMDVRTMMRTFGRRMGLRFSDETIAAIFRQYGGHPLLTRMACSFVHLRMDPFAGTRPITIDDSVLSASQAERDTELVYYCRHVVSEIRMFYEIEYEILEMIARGQQADFYELAAAHEDVFHIERYGLIVRESRNLRFAIPVLQNFVARDAMRNRGEKIVRGVEPLQNRAEWLRRRVKTILRDIREMIRIADGAAAYNVYGKNEIPEAERFAAVPVVGNAADFRDFIITSNRCLVESTDLNQTKNQYPRLWNALDRIRVYRNNEAHLRLTQACEARARQFLEEDTFGQEIADETAFYFLLQQACLDDLFAALQETLDTLE